MTKKQKEVLVQDLTNSFYNQGAIIVCDYKGMTVKKLEEIRKQADEKDIKVKVIKNSLAKISLKNANCENFDFNQNNIFIWGENQLTTCKIAYQAESNNSDFFSIKGGLIESKISDIKTIYQMAKLPDRKELLGMLLNVWNGPARSISIGLSALVEKRESIIETEKTESEN